MTAGLRRASFFVGVLTVWPVVGCSDELGPCDEAAAREIVYGRGGTVATKGQALIHDSCGGGALCHSSAARGEARHGAPGNLSFDMLPQPVGWPELIELRELIWETIENGSMPPDGVGSKTVGDGDWAFDRERRGVARLPPLSSRAGKAAVRNWLACGAPVVADGTLPSWAVPPVEGDAGALTGWHDLFTQVIEPSCANAGCHDSPAAGNLVLVDECEAHAALLQSSGCGGPRVVPGDEQSYLIDKLESASPRCGAPMPPSGRLAAHELDAVREWVKAGAQAPTCK